MSALLFCPTCRMYVKPGGKDALRAWDLWWHQPCVRFYAGHVVVYSGPGRLR